MNKLDKHLDRIQEFDPVTLAAVGTTIGAVNLILFSTRTYKDYFTKAARQCSGLPPKEKAICMVRAKILATNVQLQKLKGSMSKCAKAKSAEKCKMKVGAKVKSLALTVRDLADRLKQLKTQEYKA